MAKIKLSKQSYEATREEGSVGELELKFQGLSGFSLDIKKGSLTDAVKYLESEARKRGATHIFNLRCKTVYPQERPYIPFGHYEVIGDAYGPFKKQ